MVVSVGVAVFDCKVWINESRMVFVVKFTFILLVIVQLRQDVPWCIWRLMCHWYIFKVHAKLKKLRQIADVLIFNNRLPRHLTHWCHRYMVIMRGKSVKIENERQCQMSNIGKWSHTNVWSKLPVGSFLLKLCSHVLSFQWCSCIQKKSVYCFQFLISQALSLIHISEPTRPY